MENDVPIKWSVTRDIQGNTGLTNVNIEEVLYLGVDSRTSTIIVNTRKEVYYTTGTLKYWTHLLNSDGYHFIAADRTFSVNVCKIVMINKIDKLAYFDLNDLSKHCTLSKSGLKEVIAKLNLINTSVLYS